jgi:hypothetical protein
MPAIHSPLPIRQHNNNQQLDDDYDNDNNNNNNEQNQDNIIDENHTAATLNPIKSIINHHNHQQIPKQKQIFTTQNNNNITTHRKSSNHHHHRQPTIDSLTTQIWELESQVSSLQRQLDRTQQSNQQAIQDACRMKEIELTNQFEQQYKEAIQIQNQLKEELEFRSLQIQPKDEEILKLKEMIESQDKSIVVEITQLENKLSQAQQLAKEEILSQQHEIHTLKTEITKLLHQHQHQQQEIHTLKTELKKKLPTAKKNNPSTKSNDNVIQQQQQQLPPDESPYKLIMIQNDGLRASLWRERGERVHEATKRDAEIEIAQQRADEAIARALNAVRLVSNNPSKHRQQQQPPPPPPPSRYLINSPPIHNNTSVTIKKPISKHIHGKKKNILT